MTKKSLWQLLWDYDPNGLIVVTPELLVTIVNPAFCSMFKIAEKDIVGYSLTKFFSDAHDFLRVWETKTIVPAEKKHYDRYNLYVRRLIFPIPDEALIAAIFVNLTDEWRAQRNAEAWKQQVLDEVSAVANEQIYVVQHVAQLLGTAIAKTHLSLHRLAELIEINKL